MPKELGHGITYNSGNLFIFLYWIYAIDHSCS